MNFRCRTRPNRLKSNCLIDFGSPGAGPRLVGVVCCPQECVPYHKLRPTRLTALLVNREESYCTFLTRCSIPFQIVNEMNLYHLEVRDGDWQSTVSSLPF